MIHLYTHTGNEHKHVRMWMKNIFEYSIKIQWDKTNVFD